MTDAIVLGLAGANWDLLGPWLADGRLPNLQSLRESGTYADLRSERPPTGTPNWRCYSTGKNPGRLGVFAREQLDTETGTWSVPTARSFRSADFWDYLAADGQSVGVMNLPGTYPPVEVEGFVVAGGPVSEQEAYTHPPELGDRLDEQGYRLHPETPVPSPDDPDAAGELVELVDQRLETFRRLLASEEPDVAHLTVLYTDVLHHVFYRGEPTLQAWEVVDEHVGAIRETYPEATLFLVSDHGCVPADAVFAANAWLAEAGYLATEPGEPSGSLERVGRRLSDLADRLGIHGLAGRLIPDGVRDRLSPAGDATAGPGVGRVDWERTRAVATGGGLVHVVDEGAAGDVMYDLSQLEDEHGPVATEVFSALEAYEGPFVARAPDVVFDSREGVHVSDTVEDVPVFADPDDRAAANVRTGLFLADGPDVVQAVPDREDFEVGLTDVAPTVLASVGCPVPMDVDGDPLQLFEGAPEFRQSIDAPDRSELGAPALGEAARERLAELGSLT